MLPRLPLCLYTPIIFPQSFKFGLAPFIPKSDPLRSILILWLSFIFFLNHYNILPPKYTHSQGSTGDGHSHARSAALVHPSSEPHTQKPKQ
ncbi:hypothetical protein GMOD_00002678 [Pyrenophora seminiperda CCB06]|uniref:Uncharacterized protein n=1 Tax=Pyrenophora seminiperda CCB06 TaxID=1302712 RepID=A0A3M7M2R4_9PLEO|nr:hypothetical protein GMOD_00002678 [Pyrenophora seminiperda CCB06]